MLFVVSTAPATTFLLMSRGCIVLRLWPRLDLYSGGRTALTLIQRRMYVVHVVASFWLRRVAESALLLLLIVILILRRIRPLARMDPLLLVVVLILRRSGLLDLVRLLLLIVGLILLAAIVRLHVAVLTGLRLPLRPIAGGRSELAEPLA